MAKRYSAQETLDYLLQSSDEEGTVSEEEDLTEADPNYMDEDEEAEEESEEDSEEREGPETFLLKNREILWTSIPPPQTQGRAGAEEVRKIAPGPTRYAIVRAEDIKSTFELFFTSSMQQKLLDMTNRGAASVW